MNFKIPDTVFVYPVRRATDEAKVPPAQPVLFKRPLPLGDQTLAGAVKAPKAIKKTVKAEEPQSTATQETETAISALALLYNSQ